MSANDSYDDEAAVTNGVIEKLMRGVEAARMTDMPVKQGKSKKKVNRGRTIKRNDSAKKSSKKLDDRRMNNRATPESESKPYRTVRDAKVEQDIEFSPSAEAVSPGRKYSRSTRNHSRSVASRAGRWENNPMPYQMANNSTAASNASQNLIHAQLTHALAQNPVRNRDSKEYKAPSRQTGRGVDSYSKDYIAQSRQLGKAMDSHSKEHKPASRQSGKDIGLESKKPTMQNAEVGLLVHPPRGVRSPRSPRAEKLPNSPRQLTRETRQPVSTKTRREERARRSRVPKRHRTRKTRSLSDDDFTDRSMSDSTGEFSGSSGSSDFYTSNESGDHSSSFTDSSASTKSSFEGNDTSFEVEKQSFSDSSSATKSSFEDEATLSEVVDTLSEVIDTSFEAEKEVEDKNRVTPLQNLVGLVGGMLWNSADEADEINATSTDYSIASRNQEVTPKSSQVFGLWSSPDDGSESMGGTTDMSMEDSILESMASYARGDGSIYTDGVRSFSSRVSKEGKYPDESILDVAESEDTENTDGDLFAGVDDEDEDETVAGSAQTAEEQVEISLSFFEVSKRRAHVREIKPLSEIERQAKKQIVQDPGCFSALFCVRDSSLLKETGVMVPTSGKPHVHKNASVFAAAIETHRWLERDAMRLGAYTEEEEEGETSFDSSEGSYLSSSTDSFSTMFPNGSILSLSSSESDSEEFFDAIQSLEEYMEAKRTGKFELGAFSDMNLLNNAMKEEILMSDVEQFLLERLCGTKNKTKLFLMTRQTDLVNMQTLQLQPAGDIGRVNNRHVKLPIQRLPRATRLQMDTWRQMQEDLRILKTIVREDVLCLGREDDFHPYERFQTVTSKGIVTKKAVNQLVEANAKSDIAIWHVSASKRRAILEAVTLEATMKYDSVSDSSIAARKSPVTAKASAAKKSLEAKKLSALVMDRKAIMPTSKVEVPINTVPADSSSNTLEATVPETKAEVSIETVSPPGSDEPVSQFSFWSIQSWFAPERKVEEPNNNVTLNGNVFQPPNIPSIPVSSEHEDPEVPASSSKTLEKGALEEVEEPQETQKEQDESVKTEMSQVTTRSSNQRKTKKIDPSRASHGLFEKVQGLIQNRLQEEDEDPREGPPLTIEESRDDISVSKNASSRDAAEEPHTLKSNSKDRAVLASSSYEMAVYKAHKKGIKENPTKGSNQAEKEKTSTGPE